MLHVECISFLMEIFEGSFLVLVLESLVVCICIDLNSCLLTLQGLSGGGHFDPDNTRTHACPGERSIAYHRGDLGNWDVLNGAINQEKYFLLYDLLFYDTGFMF